MIDSLDQYWTVQDKVLYTGDEYHRKYTIDVREFYTVAFKVSVLATLSIFIFGGLVCLL